MQQKKKLSGRRRKKKDKILFHYIWRDRSDGGVTTPGRFCLFRTMKVEYAKLTSRVSSSSSFSIHVTGQLFFNAFYPESYDFLA